MLPKVIKSNQMLRNYKIPARENNGTITKSSENMQINKKQNKS